MTVILNFGCFRLERKTGLRGGGIAFYCRKGIKTSAKLKSNADSTTESLGIEIQGLNHQKRMIIYNPHRLNNLATFFDQLKSISLIYENVIICADFNIKLLWSDLLSQRCFDNITTCGLYIVKRYPTRFAPNCNPALPDIMACSDKSLSIHFVQLSLVECFDHDVLCL